MQNSKKNIATFVKHMICPDNIINNNLIELGENDFNKYPYKHQQRQYAGNSIPSNDILLENISNSLHNSLTSEKKILLLLSDGKDSMSLALAYHHLGISVTTLTLLRKEDSELRDYIKASAEAMGHKPFFLDVEEIISAFDANYFVEACKQLPYPVMDQALLFFVFGIKKFFEDSSIQASDYIVIDGMGNDETFGHLPTPNQLKAFKLSKAKLWKLVPHSAGRIRWFIRSPFESHGGLSALSCFFPIPKAHDLNKYFSFAANTLEPQEFVDFRAFSRGNFNDRQCMMGKTKIAARAAGTDVYFPWAEKELSHYVFNLPITSKFCFESLTNKLLLRDLLIEQIGWKQAKRGVDLYFDIDPMRFNKEILSLIVPSKFILTIDKKAAPKAIKQRAYLELINVVAYCNSRGWGEAEVNEILNGVK